MMKWLFLAGAAAVLAGCAGALGGREDRITSEVDQSVREAESRAQLSRTLSSLAKLEEALTASIKREGRVPESLDQLIPRYLAEIPPVELGVSGHSDSALVRNYPPGVLRAGQIDGSQLRDTGRWGYVHNDRQVVVFIDCTHKSALAGKPWYQVRTGF